MATYNNPFSIDRAEQLGDRLFEFYSNHKNFDGLLKNKSLILEGGRGSGKTMFFLYNSYFSKKKEAISKGINFKKFLSDQNLIGIHFRADSNFVTAFQHKGLNENEWKPYFGHFINISLSKRLVEIIIDIESSLDSKNENIIFNFSNEIQTLFNTKLIIDNFKKLLKIITEEEIKLMNFINNLNRVESPIVIGNGYLLNLIAKSLLSQKLMKDKSIHVFIDEYENLLTYQQQILNTLIKHPNPVIIDVGIRNEGLKTHQTLAESEIITHPHDFNHFNFEKFTPKEYEELILDICKKRLLKIDDLVKLNDPKYLDIKYYLGKYNIKEEVSFFMKKEQINNLKSLIISRIGNEKKFELFYNTDDIILLRLNIVLLERNSLSVDDLLIELKKYLNKENSKYDDLLHNNKNGLVYLICKENRVDKLYYGFNTYISISSGIIRFFIELCEVAFKNAFRNNNLDFNNPRPLTANEQTQAAYYVSQCKVNDIETYTPYSDKMKRFVMLLGGIFENFHRDIKLSEPEKNHFSTNFDKLKTESKDFLKSAELYSVLQKKEQTKIKSSDINSNNSEFHLNHIYAPYFHISPRKIRSLFIEANNLDVLINSDSLKANEVANRIVKSKEFNSQLKIDLL